MASPATTSRMKTLRRRSLMGRRTTLLGRREDDEQAAVVVVGREQVGRRARRQVALGVDLDGLAQHAYAPLERGGHLVVAVLELEAEHVHDRAPDHLLLSQPGELRGAAADPEQPALLVAHEEGGVGGRVVVVEQLEQEAEAALVAAPGLTAETCRALAGGGAVAAVGTDEEVGHGSHGGYEPARG